MHAARRHPWHTEQGNERVGDTCAGGIRWDAPLKNRGAPGPKAVGLEEDRKIIENYGSSSL